MPHTKNRPKCLVRVGRHPILHYTLRALEMYGVRRVTIVIGYGGSEVRKYAVRNFPNLSFGFIKNPRYLSTNDLYSLYLARKHLSGRTVLLDSDVLFHPGMLVELKASGSVSAMCFRRVACGNEEMKVSANRRQFAFALNKNIDPTEAIGEYMGIALLSTRFSRRLVAALVGAVKRGGVAQFRETAYEEVFREKGTPMKCIDVTHLPAVEVDFPADLKKARREVLPLISAAFSEYL